MHHHDRIMIEKRYTVLILEITHQTNFTLLFEVKGISIINFKF